MDASRLGHNQQSRGQRRRPHCRRDLHAVGGWVDVRDDLLQQHDDRVLNLIRDFHTSGNELPRRSGGVDRGAANHWRGPRPAARLRPSVLLQRQFGPRSRRGCERRGRRRQERTGQYGCKRRHALHRRRPGANGRSMPICQFGTSWEPIRLDFRLRVRRRPLRVTGGAMVPLDRRAVANKNTGNMHSASATMICSSLCVSWLMLASPAFGSPARAMTVSVGKTIEITSSKRYCWYPTIHRFSTGEILVTIRMSPDEVHPEGDFSAYCISRDGGQTWSQRYTMGAGCNVDAAYTQEPPPDGTLMSLGAGYGAPVAYPPGQAREFHVAVTRYSRGGMESTQVRDAVIRLRAPVS